MSGQKYSGRGDFNDVKNEAMTMAHPTVERLRRAEPTGGREHMVGKNVCAVEEAKVEVDGKLYVQDNLPCQVTLER